MQNNSDNTKNNNMKDFSEVTDFHGHICPGSALGYKAAQMGLNNLSSSRSEDEEIVTLVENDSCAVDAIQVLTGCTFGKGNLIFNDYGKQVYTFLNRSSGEGVRISLKDSFEMDKIDPKMSILRKKVSSGKSNPAEKELLNEKVQSVANKILEMNGEEIFKAEKVNIALPPKASIFKSINCEKCGELVSEHRIKEINGIKVCIPCSKDKI